MCNFLEPNKAVPETNGLQGLLRCMYSIISDCYGEFQAVSTVKGKTLRSVAAN